VLLWRRGIRRERRAGGDGLRTCGGHLFAEHPPLKLTDVFAAMIPQLKFTPGVHVNYQERVLPIRDGLAKMKNFPKEFGGSGELLPE
jgi:hypothetical protein